MKTILTRLIVPLVGKIADTPGKKKAVYILLSMLGAVLAYLGISIIQVSLDQILTLDQTPLG